MPVRERPGSVVTIGAYDGVHLGHRRVIDEVCRIAQSEGLESVVVTFDRHPASVVRPASAPLQLTDLPQKLELLQATGIDEVSLVEFTAERAAETAEQFVEEFLVGELAARVIVVGRDFHFGKARGGNVALLEAIGPSRGFRVVPFELVADRDGGPPVSSTRIRGLIAGGELAAAATLLGRPHEVRGIVVAEASGYERDQAGSGADSIEVAPGILLPPPGGYEALVGVVGAAGTPLEACRAVVDVTPRRGGTPVTVLGLGEAYGRGTPLRVLFPSDD